MNIICPNCKTEYKVTASVIKKGSKVKCKKCKQIFPVYPPKNGSSLAFEATRSEIPSQYYFYFDNLSPKEALNLLAETSSKNIDGSYFNNLRIKCNVFQSGINVSIIFPDAQSEKRSYNGRKEKKHILEALREVYKKISGVNAEPIREESITDSISFIKGIVWLLLLNSIDKSDEIQPFETDRFLIVSKNIDHQRARFIFDEIYYNATNVELSCGENNDKFYYLFDVLDDQERKSSFLSSIAGKTFNDSNILRCFELNNYSVYLPFGYKPTENALNDFCKIFQNIPEFFARQNIESGRLIAVLTLPHTKEELPKKQFEILNLIGLRFFNQVQFLPKMISRANFYVSDLSQSQEKLENLSQIIDNAEPSIGYRLELRKTKFEDDVDNERNRLLEKQSDIEYKLAYIESILPSKPILLRFNQKQLPALADVLRSFPNNVLRDGKLKYAYQSTRKNPSGLHFIMIDPSISQMTEQLDPLLMWTKTDEPPVKFWLDPSWARYYNGNGNDSLIFVPEKTSLSPPMHGWDVEDMDSYMRSVLKQWFHGKYGIDDIQKIEKPIYIFDATPQPDKDIEISILNQDNMKPLITQLGWINDNLIIIDSLGNEKFIEEMAKDITGQKIAERIHEKSEIIIESFEKTAEKTSQNISEKLDLLAQICSSEIKELVSKTDETINKIINLKEQLNSFVLTQKEMEELNKEAQNAKDKTEKKSKELENEMKKLENTVNPNLIKAESSIKETKEKIIDAIKKLKETRNQLKQELGKL